MKTIIQFIALLITLSSYGQLSKQMVENRNVNLSYPEAKSTKEVKAEELYSKYAFQKAIAQYSIINDLTLEGKRNLAESFRLVNDFESSKIAYEEFVLDPVASDDDIFWYASVLRSLGDYEESDFWMHELYKRNPEDLRANNFVNQKHALSSLLVDYGHFKVHHLFVNTDKQDFGASYWGDNNVIFSSSRDGGKPIKRHYNWNEQSFLNMFQAEINGNFLSNVEPLDKSINGKMHEGPASFCNKGTYMAYTKNNYDGYDEDAVIKLKVFFSKLNTETGTWSEEEAFYLNNDDYSVGHPSLTENGNVMYFASDMPGGFGGVDIYRIEKNKKGEWTDPVNLGKHINTEADELFPFYHEESQILFFSSNGQFGIGGLDMFVSPEIGEGEFVKVINLGTPLNTKSDDFGFVANKDLTNGFFSSNRVGGFGDDDIYSFELIEKLNFGKLLKGTALDTEGNILANTKVVLSDINGYPIGSMTTKNDGQYQFTIEANKDFKLLGTRPDYFDGTNTATSKTPEDIIIADVILEKDPDIALYALVTDRKTGDALEGVEVDLIDNMTDKKMHYTTPETGDFRNELEDKKLNDRGSYNFILKKEGYFDRVLTYNKQFTKPGEYKVHVELDFSMDKKVETLNEMVEINPIYFDYDKFNIRPDAAVELDKIVKIMNKYPDMVVELGAHTDCRGSKKYNEKLSANRATSSAYYIKSRIKKPERIYGVGYGENKLINDCACEGRVKSNCDEATHQENRRTEFRVISVGSDKLKVKNNSPNTFSE